MLEDVEAAPGLDSYDPERKREERRERGQARHAQMQELGVRVPPAREGVSRAHTGPRAGEAANEQTKPWMPCRFEVGSKGLLHCVGRIEETPDRELREAGRACECPRHEPR